MNNDILNTPIEFLKGVGPNRAKLIKDELKISNFKDLLFQFPYRYIDKTKYHKISEIDNINSEIQLIGEIKELKEVGVGSKNDWLEVLPIRLELFNWFGLKRINGL